MWLRNRHRMGIGTANRHVRMAAAVDAAPAAVGEAVAAGKVNLEQAQAITQAVDRLPRDVGVQVRADAAAALVGYHADLDPAQLTVVGERILHLLSFIPPLHVDPEQNPRRNHHRQRRPDSGC